MTPSFNRFLFIALQKAIGSNVGRYYREFLDIDTWPRERLERLSEQRLETVLRHAVRNVPFYRERVTAKNPTLDDFPILTKTLIYDHFDQLKMDGLQPAKGYSWKEVTTGGSTGKPSKVIHDAEYRDRGRACRMYCQWLCGFPFGTPYFRLWGSLEDVQQKQKSRVQRLIQYLANEELLNAFQMDTEHMEQYLKRINQSRSDYLMAYVDAADAIARQGKPVRPLKSIMACAGTVMESNRSRLETFYGARVHNKYGCRECGDMACDCSEGGLHVFDHHTRIDIVDDHGSHLPEKQTGRVLVTMLGNLSFPMIRYEIGDMGSSLNGSCSCGRPFSLLQGIEGRKVEFLEGADGRYISPVYIRHLVGVVHAYDQLKRFQLVQKTDGRFLLRLELGGSGHDAWIRGLKADLAEAVGRSSVLEHEVVDRIEPTASGKYIYVLREPSTLLK